MVGIPVGNTLFIEIRAHTAVKEKEMDALIWLLLTTPNKRAEINITKPLILQSIFLKGG